MRQSGTSGDELLVGAALAKSTNGSDVVMAGRTEGDWASSNAGGFDFCAAVLDADGNELWLWQVSPIEVSITTQQRKEQVDGGKITPPARPHPPHHTRCTGKWNSTT